MKVVRESHRFVDHLKELNPLDNHQKDQQLTLSWLIFQLVRMPPLFDPLLGEPNHQEIPMLIKSWHKQDIKGRLSNLRYIPASLQAKVHSWQPAKLNMKHYIIALLIVDRGVNLALWSHKTLCEILQQKCIVKISSESIQRKESLEQIVTSATTAAVPSTCQASQELLQDDTT